MKKQILLIGALIIGMAVANADPIQMSAFQVQLTSANSSADKLILVESADMYSDALDYGVDNEKNLSITNAATNTGIYAVTNLFSSGRADKLGTNDLDKKYIGVMTNTTDVTYTFTFLAASYVEGHIDLYLLDHVTGISTAIVKDATYSFTLDAVPTTNTYINDRFQIVKPSEPTICHQYGKLIITGHVGDKVKVLDMEGEEAIAEQTIDSDNKVIELSSLTSGELYQVVLGEETMIIRVQ